MGFSGEALKIPNPVFKYVEYQLYNHDANKQLLHELEEDVIHGSGLPPFSSVGRGSGISDPTGTKTVRLRQGEIKELRRRVQVVEETLASSKRFTKVFRLKYQEQMKLGDILKALECGERSFYRYRRQLVSMVAAKLNLVVEI